MVRSWLTDTFDYNELKPFGRLTQMGWVIELIYHDSNVCPSKGHYADEKIPVGYLGNISFCVAIISHLPSAWALDFNSYQWSLLICLRFDNNTLAWLYTARVLCYRLPAGRLTGISWASPFA